MFCQYWHKEVGESRPCVDKIKLESIIKCEVVEKNYCIGSRCNMSLCTCIRYGKNNYYKWTYSFVKSCERKYSNVYRRYCCWLYCTHKRLALWSPHWHYNDCLDIDQVLLVSSTTIQYCYNYFCGNMVSQFTTIAHWDIRWTSWPTFGTKTTQYPLNYLKALKILELVGWVIGLWVRCSIFYDRVDRVNGLANVRSLQLLKLSNLH